MDRINISKLMERVKNEIPFDKILMTAMKAPGAQVNREIFLRKELTKYCKEETIKDAIANNPAHAGISVELINKISMEVINLETTKVTGISVLASLPSSVNFTVALGAATADITSYFVFILRTVQELAYLYGFKQFDLKNDSVDSETMHQLLLFMGVMFGVQEATRGLQKFANMAAVNVAKKLANKPLMKGIIYPIVKNIATKIGVRMTKQVFADWVASAIPFVGFALSGGITYISFRPNCKRLREHLMSYNLCNPDFYIDVVVEESENDNSGEE